MTDHHGAGSRERLIEWMLEGTRRFEGAVAVLDDANLQAPCALDGWTRAHLASHLARNADALGNLLAWARTGVATPMYPSADARAADIESGAVRDPAEIRTDLVESDARFAAAIANHPDAAWSGAARSALGRPITADEVPWMRIREVWIHLVDLDVGSTFAEIPPAVLAALLDDASGWLGAREGAPNVALAASDHDGTWTVAGSGPPTRVTGPIADLTAWLLGRAAPATLATDHGTLPELPRWL